MTPTSAVIQKFDSHSVSLLGQGWPSLLTNTARVQRCRQLYDLQLFMNGIESKTESLIPICNIIAKAILVESDVRIYAVRQPNHYEHH